MPAANIRISGHYGAVNRFEQMRNELGQFTGVVALVGSDLVYAYGIEYGQHRYDKRWRRKAGPAHYLKGAFDQVRDTMRQDVVRAFDKGGDRAADIARKDIGEDIAGMARYLAPVGSDADKRPGHPGLLQRSIRYFPVKSGWPQGSPP